MDGRDLFEDLSAAWWVPGKRNCTSFPALPWPGGGSSSASLKSLATHLQGGKSSMLTPNAEVMPLRSPFPGRSWVPDVALVAVGAAASPRALPQMLLSPSVPRGSQRSHHPQSPQRPNAGCSPRFIHAPLLCCPPLNLQG